MLGRLGCQYRRVQQGVWSVVPPSYRFDLHIEEDLIEELLRSHGFDQLPEYTVKWQTNLRYTVPSRMDVFCRRLVSLGYQEVISYAFASDVHLAMNRPDLKERGVKLKNPIVQAVPYMRMSLIPALLEALSSNQKYRCLSARMFECARVFWGETPEEQPLHIAGLIWGKKYPESWASEDTTLDIFDVKYHVERLLCGMSLTFEAYGLHPVFHPGRCARIAFGDRVLGFLGELHPKWVGVFDLFKASVPVLFEINMEYCVDSDRSGIAVLSKLPVMHRDLAFIVDEELVYSDLYELLCREGQDECLQDVVLFDVYRGPRIPEGKKSLALRFVLQHPERTLTEEEIQPKLDKWLEIARNHFGAYIRE